MGQPILLRRRAVFFLLFLISLSVLQSMVLASAQTTEVDVSKTVTINIEAEAFQFPGDWRLISSGHLSGGQGLGAATGAPQDAATVIKLPKTGNYALWVRSIDFSHNKPGTRRYQLKVDGQAATLEAGSHMEHDGWWWQKLGTMHLSAGIHVLSLHSTTSYGRCDAVLLTTSRLNPNTKSISQIDRYTISPVKLSTKKRGQQKIKHLPKIIKSSFHKIAQIGNELVRVSFLRGKDTLNSYRVIKNIELYIDGKWRQLPLQQSSSVLFLLYSPSANLSTKQYWPRWSNPRNNINVDLGEKTYVIPVASRNPYSSGHVERMIARSCRKINSRTVQIIYRGVDSNQKIVSRWSIKPNLDAIHLSFSFTAEKTGFYSVGFSAFQSWNKQQLQQVFLPPLYEYQRLSNGPRIITSSETPHSMALAQIEFTGNPAFKKPLTFSVIADPAKLPFQWATATNAPYGFSLINSNGNVQPTIFSPVLGMVGSKMTSGKEKTVSWYMMAKYGNWMDALAATSNKLFKVTDYRRPINTSLTNAALNVIDLIKNAKASGWDAKLKGFYSIESKDTVIQTAPLTLLSAAILTGDDQLYAKRALPSIEFTLSRPGPGFSVKKSSYVSSPNTKLHVPSKFFGASYWAGVYQMLGQDNPWAKQFMYDKNGKLKHIAAYSSIPKWSALLAKYRLHPNKALLNKIKQQADTWILKEYNESKSNIPDLWDFYNISFYPYWWELPDLYDLTGDKSSLKAAEIGAFRTIAGIWSQPPIPNSNVLINPKGKFIGQVSPGWKGAKRYHVGYPRHAGDTPSQVIPAWEVSQVGLGIEEPASYYAPTGGMRNITMANWAPHLLRMYGETGRKIYRIYARNSIIGRFANYPGYYIRGFTNIYQNRDYPYKGPDVTGIYYHHIPAFLSFVFDYLVTEAHVRSHKKISFPYVRQQGYAWFTDRVFGAAPGRVFKDHRVALRLGRKNIQVNSKDINYLIGRGEHQLWVILMNDSHKAVTAPIAIDSSAYGIKDDQPYRIFDADGSVLGTGRFAGTLHKKVPALGLIALSFPTSPAKVAPNIVSLKKGRLQTKLPDKWGTLQAFRIRGPFRKDALYIVLTGRPETGSEAKLIIAGLAKPIDITSYPYEFSIYPWRMSRDMKFHVSLKSKSGKTFTTRTLTLPGTTSGASSQ